MHVFCFNTKAAKWKIGTAFTHSHTLTQSHKAQKNKPSTHTHLINKCNYIAYYDMICDILKCVWVRRCVSASIDICGCLCRCGRGAHAYKQTVYHICTLICACNWGNGNICLCLGSNYDRPLRCPQPTSVDIVFIPQYSRLPPAVVSSLLPGVAHCAFTIYVLPFSILHFQLHTTVKFINAPAVTLLVATGVVFCFCFCFSFFLFFALCKERLFMRYVWLAFLI